MSPPFNLPFTGTGILAIFAAQAGAKKVYAVEASNMAPHARKLIEANHFGDRIEIVSGKIQDIVKGRLKGGQVGVRVFWYLSRGNV